MKANIAYPKKPGFRSGIHLLIKKSNKYLVLKRSGEDQSDPNHWDLPGGGIDYLEKPLDAALREAKEEAGLEVRITKIIDLWATIFKNDWSIESLVEAEYLSGEVALSPEHSEYKWVSKEDLKNIEPKGRNLKALFNVNETLIGGLNF